MDVKVVIVVKRLNWYCVSCSIVNKHDVSVDEHLKACHVNLLSLTSATSPCSVSEFEQDAFSFSDGERCDQFNEVVTYEDSSQCSGEVSELSVQQHLSVKRNKICETEHRSSSANPEKSTENITSRVLKSETENRSSKTETRTKNVTSGCLTEKSQREPPEAAISSRLRKRSAVSSFKGDKFDQRQRTESDTNLCQHKKSRLFSASKQQLNEIDCPSAQKPKLSVNGGNTTSLIIDESKPRNNQPKTNIAASNRTASVKSSLDKTDSDSHGDVVSRRKKGRLKASFKEKSNVRKMKKNTNMTTKKPGLGGKPVKRSMEISTHEMDSLKLCYIGNHQTQSVSQETNFATSNSVPNSIPMKDGHCGLDSSSCENRSENLVLQDTSVNKSEMIASDIQGKIVDITGPSEASQASDVCRNQIGTRTEKGVSGGATLPDFDSRPSLNKNNVTHTSVVSGGQINPSNQCVSTLPESKSDSLVQSDESSTACGVDNSLNTLTITDTVKDKGEHYAKQSRATDSEEWVKSKTNFDFTKRKLVMCFEQPSKIHKCSICQAQYSTAEYLSDHMSKMSAYLHVQCSSCQQPFHNVHYLNFHVFETHEKKRKPFCFHCREKFSTMETFEKHLHGHMCNEAPDFLHLEYHCCSLCKDDVPCQYDSLRKHYSNKHQVALCLECFVKSELVLLSDAALVREHKKSHTHFCNVCFQDFSSLELLSAHLPFHSKALRIEDGQGTLCTRCNRWCPNKGLATLHHKEHKLQVMREWRVEKWGVGFTCVHCDKVLRNKRNLERHIAQLHSDSRSYNFHCEFCGKGVDSKNILKDHIAIHHLGIKRYRCEYCDERFACAPTLRRHVLKEHTTDRQYTCEVCGMRFFERFKLTKHMSAHTGLARFMCEQCGKGFHSNSEFKKHAAVHAEKGEFVCQGCGLEYKRKEHLKRHSEKCNKSVPSYTHHVMSDPF